MRVAVNGLATVITFLVSRGADVNASSSDVKNTKFFMSFDTLSP